MNNQSTLTRPIYKQAPGVVFAPGIQRGVQRGIHKIVEAIRPTLGPKPKLTAIERIPNTKPPEILDSGGIIARRIIDLPDPDENVGAMFIRGVLWNLHERVGDGVATAAVIFQAIYDQGLKTISAGGNAMLLHRYLEAGMRTILSALDEQTLPLESREALVGVAKAVCYDDELATKLSEIFDLIGEHGILEIRTGRHRQIERNFIEGSYWPGGVASKLMIDDPVRNRTDLHNAAILITDLEIEDPQMLAPVIHAAVQSEVNNLVVVARKFSDPVTGLFVRSQSSGKLRMLAVKTPGMRADAQMIHMEDIATLTGGQPVHTAAGDTLARIGREHFGYARRIWANHDYLGIIHGKGDPRQRRRTIARLRGAVESADKAEERQTMRERIGRLSGGAASIEIGGITESEIETRKELAQRTAEALRRVIKGGVLTGGGTALLACRPALVEMMGKNNTPEERAAGRILIAALEAPFRTLVQNAGYQPGAVFSNLDAHGPGCGFDVQTGIVVDMAEAGILDIAAVQKQAVYSAIRSAGLALTIDVVVHRKKPPVATHPDERAR